MTNSISGTDKLIIAGDFNARVECDHQSLQKLIGYQGLEKCNFNGELPLAFCLEHNVVISNPIFKHKDHHKTTWMHPRFQHWHPLDMRLQNKWTEEMFWTLFTVVQNAVQTST